MSVEINGQFAQLGLDLPGIGGSTSLETALAETHKRSFPAGANFAVFGDSRCANSTFNLSGSLRTEGNGIAFWVETLSRGRVRFRHDLNFGVGSEKTFQVLARVADVIASDAHVVGVLCSVNDGTGTIVPLAQRLADITAIATELTAGGKIVILVAELPFVTADTTRISNHLRMRQHILSLGDLPGVYVADPFPLIVDPASATMAPLTGMLYDGLHQSPSCSHLISQEISRILTTLYPEPAILPASNADLYHATNNPTGCLNTNPMLTGTGGTIAGTATGPIAASWTANAAQLTMTCSKVTVGGKDWQQAVITGTPVAAANAQLQQALTLSQFTVGDVLEAVCEVDVDANAANLYPLHLSLSSGGVVESVRAGYGGTSPEYGFTTAKAWAGVLRTPRFTFKTGMTSMLTTLNVIGKSGSGATAMTYRARAWSVRKVLD